jgi:hydroxyacylglutathione hydrolase
MKRSTLLNFFVVFTAVLFALAVAVPAQEEIQDFSALRHYENLATGITTSRDTFELIDVRTPGEFASGHIPTAENIEYQIIHFALADLQRDRPVVVYCRTGSRSAQATRLLRQAGFTTVVDFGGVNRWRGSLVR